MWPCSKFAVMALLAAAAAGFSQPLAAQESVGRPHMRMASAEAEQKLVELGYPRDMRLAIPQWRAINGRQRAGALSTEEELAVLKEAPPTTFGAVAGDPMRNPGIAWNKPTREAAETEAARRCREFGGGSACSRIFIVTGHRCIAFAGTSFLKDGKSIRILTSSTRPDQTGAIAEAKQNCAKDPDGGALCVGLAVVCADGSHARRAAR